MQKQRTTAVWMVAVACVLMVISACGNTGINNAGNTNGIKSNSYGDDGYLGRTNSYPKIPGHNMVNNYNADNNLINQAIQNVPGVNGSNVTFNGADAYVTIKLDPGLEAREIPTVEREAASVLRFNFPRYTIHVSSTR
ncbi:hypothetical protein [Cohnella sp.]|uniref:hypothetical protein n=1 Tax=Cohnella sp. TaxID=1883426 RepID=UPI0035619DB3